MILTHDQLSMISLYFLFDFLFHDKSVEFFWKKEVVTFEMTRITTLAGKIWCMPLFIFSFQPKHESFSHSDLSLGLCLVMCQLGELFLNRVLSPQQVFLKPPKYGLYVLVQYVERFLEFFF